MMQMATAASRERLMLIDIEQTLDRAGFEKKAEGIYQKRIDNDHGYWIAAFNERNGSRVSFGYIWYRLNAFAFKQLREAFKPYKAEFSPEIGPALYMCPVGNSSSVYSDRHQLEPDINKFLSDEYAQHSLYNAVDEAISRWPYQESHKILLPAAFAMLGRADDLQKYSELYLNGLGESQLAKPYRAYYDALKSGIEAETVTTR